MPSSSSLTQYNSMLRRMEEAGIPLEILVSEPETALTWIQENASPTKNISTINNFLKAVIWKLRDSQMEGATEPYTLKMKGMRPALEATAKKQDLPESRKVKMLSWPEVLALEPEAKKTLSKEDYVIYCLYTMMPPVRADYAEVMVRRSNTVSSHTNHLVALMDTKKYRFIFNKYKTAETHGTVVLPVPERLAKIIKDYLLTREPVEEGKKPKIQPNTPFLKEVTNPNMLVKRVISIFKRLSGKEMSVGLLRHSYIQDFLSQKRTIVEREALAKQMMHSVVLQERYDVIEEE